MNLIKYRNFKGSSRTLYLFGSVFLLIQILLFYCADRDRNNIFDPLSGIDSLDILLYVTSADSVITVKWTPPAKVKYTGYNLYRKINNQAEFQLIASLSADKTEYYDNDISYDVKYQYYVKIVGKDGESPPSKLLNVIPGPVVFYVLDRWNYSIFKLSYDLRHILATRYTNWNPENIAFDFTNNRSLVTYPLLGYFEIFSWTTGLMDFSGSEISRPFDTYYNSKLHTFWVTDSSGSLYSINPATETINVIDKNLNRPTLLRNNNLGIFVLDVDGAKVYHYNYSGQLLNVLERFGSYQLVHPIYFTIQENSNDLYIIDKIDSENRILYKYSILTDSIRNIHQNSSMNIVNIDPSDNSVWISINNPDDASLMQLSPDGVRLSEISGFSSISDFKLIKKTNTILVADYPQHRVLHIRKESSTIGVFERAVYPSRVYSE